MNEFQTYRFRKVLKDLFSCADELKAQLEVTREHCKQVEEVMRAIRNNHFKADNRPLPKYPHSRNKAANDS